MLWLIMLVSGIICFLLGMYFIGKAFETNKDRDFFLGMLLMFVCLILLLLAIAFVPTKHTGKGGGAVVVPIIVPYG